MIYTFRFEKANSDRLDDEGRAFFWDEMKKGRLHQGWGIPGMSLLVATGSLASLEDWVPRYISAAKTAGWKNSTELKARTRYKLLSHMCAIRPGDLIVVPNISESGRDGLVLVRATGRNGISKADAMCYGWEGSLRRKDHPFREDYRHFVTIDPFSIKEVRYHGGTNKGAAHIRTELQGFRFCVWPLSEKDHPKLVRDVTALYGGKIGTPRRAKRREGRRGGGHPPNREQLARGQRAEDEMLRRLIRGGYDGLTLVEDRRLQTCGYDFLCKDASGTEIEMEVKGSALNGQLFLSENELKRAKSSKQRYWLISFLDDGGPPRRWPTRKLTNPAPQLERLGSLEPVWQLRVDASSVKWDE